MSPEAPTDPPVLGTWQEGAGVSWDGADPTLAAALWAPGLPTAILSVLFHSCPFPC